MNAIPLTSTQLQQVIDANAFSSWLQLRVQRVSKNGIELHLPSRPEMIGTEALQRVHGGIIASLIDVACGYAAMCVNGRGVSTVNLQTDFHRAATPGALSVEGCVVHLGGRLCTAHARVLDSAGTLIASGRCTLYMSREAHPALALNPPKAASTGTSFQR